MIQFLDLRREYQAIRAEIDSALLTVASSGRYILDQEVAEFERRWAEYCGLSGAVLVASGTDALTVALLASGHIRPGAGHEVITSALGSIYTPLAILHAGAVPVFADIDPDAWTLSPQSVEQVLTPRTRAIVPVHLYGLSCESDQISRFAHERGLTVIEDTCQAHGVRWGNHSQSARSVTLAFSFYPTKNLGCFGDAGAIVSSDAELIDRARVLRSGGQTTRDHAVMPGYNSRCDEIQAAILNRKLAHLDAWNQRRRALASQYVERLRLPGLRCQKVPPQQAHVYHLFVIRHPNRDQLQRHLRECGIETMVHYRSALHCQPAFSAMRTRCLPEAERAAQEVLSLPLYPGLEESEAEEIMNAVNDFVQHT
jgi:dTDP-4-amino-4,6-dideoxygalactose transaminase